MQDVSFLYKRFEHFFVFFSTFQIYGTRAATSPLRNTCEERTTKRKGKTMNFKTITKLAVSMTLLTGISSAASASVPNGDVRIRNISYNGSGCPLVR